jgi:uncharacterized protein YjiS (DUF1127 family)
MSDRLMANETAQIIRPHAWLGGRGQSVHRRFSAKALVAVWRRFRSRQRIAELDSHMLKDIGVSFAEAEAEANKPFWRA